MKPEGRLYYVDWLRVSAFAVLIAYHSSVAFFPGMPWLMKSAETSVALDLIMDFPRAWRLALLFFVSGMGTWFAFRSTTGTEFLKERTVRLFLPLIFAMCVICVPQVWYERMAEDGYQGSLLTFWLTRYFTEGRYPTGNFTWAHMWFVAYLLVICFVCYPVFRMLMLPRLKPVGDWFERMAKSDAVYLFFLLPLLLNLALTPLFPRQTNVLYNDGAWFAVWASWFGLGFLIARHHAAVIQAIIARRYSSAAFSLVLTVFLYLFCFTNLGGHSFGDYDDMTPAFKLLIFAFAWAMILTLLGFGALHLNRPSAALSWMNRKIFPLYIVHQTVVIAALYHVLPLDLGVWQKFGLVAAITAFGSLLFAVLADLLPGRLRLLVGLPASRRSRAVAQSKQDEKPAVPAGASPASGPKR